MNTSNSFLAENISSAEGSYYIAYLQPGTYRITTEAAGFKRHVREGIVLRTGEMPGVVQLKIGAIPERINITGAPPLLETETSTSGQVLDGDLLVKVPVSQKRAIRILFYMPGANAIGGSRCWGSALAPWATQWTASTVRNQF